MTMVPKTRTSRLKCFSCWKHLRLLPAIFFLVSLYLISVPLFSRTWSRPLRRWSVHFLWPSSAECPVLVQLIPFISLLWFICQAFSYVGSVVFCVGFQDSICCLKILQKSSSWSLLCSNRILASSLCFSTAECCRPDRPCSSCPLCLDTLILRIAIKPSSFLETLLRRCFLFFDV